MGDHLFFEPSFELGPVGESSKERTAHCCGCASVGPLACCTRSSSVPGPVFSPGFELPAPFTPIPCSCIDFAACTASNAFCCASICCACCICIVSLICSA